VFPARCGYSRLGGAAIALIGEFSAPISSKWLRSCDSCLSLHK
jgi:hypothetical protein